MASGQLQLEEFRRVLDHLPDGVVLHRDGVIRYANPAAAAIMGCDGPADLEGRPILDFVHEENRAVAAERIRRAVAEGVPGPPLTERLVRPDGTTILAEVVAIPFDTPEGRSVLAVARDVTEREQLAAEAQAQHRAEALLTLAEGLGHLVNNPLTGLLDRLDRLQALLASENLACDAARAEARAALAEAGQEAARIARALRTVRDMTHPVEGGAEEVQPAEAARMAATLLRDRFGNGVRLETDLHEIRPVRGSLGRLTEVCAQLLLNALQACRETARPEGHRVVMTVRREGRQAVLRVEDDGPGIPRALLPRVFDPFVTSRRDGRLGLGLARVKQVVDGLGGTIAIRSRPGATSVEVRLPLATPSEPPSRSAEGARSARVLVVDDEPLVGRTFERLFAGKHEVTVCGDGQEALELLRGGAEFDILFVDVVMPGLDGIGLYRALREAMPDRAERVVFITGGAFTDGASAFLEQTDRPVLYKPFELHTVRAMVAAAAEGADPAQAMSSS